MGYRQERTNRISRYEELNRHCMHLDLKTKGLEDTLVMTSSWATIPAIPIMA